MFFDKLKGMGKPLAWLGALLVLLLFWHAIWSFVIDIATKIRDVLPGK